MGQATTIATTTATTVVTIATTTKATKETTTIKLQKLNFQQQEKRRGAAAGKLIVMSYFCSVSVVEYPVIIRNQQRKVGKVETEAAKINETKL